VKVRDAMAKREAARQEEKLSTSAPREKRREFIPLDDGAVSSSHLNIYIYTA